MKVLDCSKGGQYGTADFGIRIGIDENYLETWRGGAVLRHHGSAGEGKKRVEKKFLKVRKIGRRNEYIAVVTEAEYQAMQTHSFLDRVYGGNVKNLVSTLLRQDILSADELKEIEAFWRNENE